MLRRSSPSSHSLLASAISAVLGAASANAATESETRSQALPKVTVTGEADDPAHQPVSPKFTAPLLDTPQTVSVIPRSLFEQQGATTLNDVLRNTPGITLNAGENAFVAGASNFNIRGFESSHNIFIDGARDQGNYARDVFNLEQVDVAKGAASDNGRGGAGGYVNLVTKSPHAEAFQHSTLSFGFDNDDSHERKRATVDVNQPIGDSAAFRVNALWQEGGVAGRDIAKKDGWGIAPSVAFGLGTPTRLIASYQYLEQNDLPDWGVPGGLIPGVTPNANPVPSTSVDRSNFYGLASDYDDNTSNSGLVRIEHDFSPSLRLSNQTRYSKTERDALYTVVAALATDAVTVTPSRQAALRENTGLTNQTNLSWKLDTGSIRHNFAFGIELSREKSAMGRNFLSVGSVAGTSIYTPDPYRAVTGGVDLTPGYVDRVEVDSAAAYAYDTLQFNERWQLTGGVRVESYDASVRTSAVGAPSVPAELIDYSVNDTTVSGKLGVVYKPSEYSSVYAAWGVSAQPPGADFLSNPDASRPGAGSAFPSLGGQNNPGAKTQASTNYELGTKWNFLDNRLGTTLALFRTERNNIGLASSGGVVTAYGKQTVKGLEISATGEISDGWTVFGGWVFMNSEKSHVDPLFDGDALALTPKQSGNLWTTYRFPFGLTVGGGLQYQGESYVGRPTNIDTHVDAGANGVLPDYLVASLFGAYELSKRVTVRLNVDNVTDELYATSLNFSARRGSLGAPRSYLLSAAIAF